MHKSDYKPNALDQTDLSWERKITQDPKGRVYIQHPQNKTKSFKNSEVYLKHLVYLALDYHMSMTEGGQVDGDKQRHRQIV